MHANNEIFKLVLRDFVRLTNLDIKTNSFECCSPSEFVSHLKHEVIYKSEHIDLFFEILSVYNYYMKQEIQDTMHHLGTLKNPNQNKEAISKLLKSPLIQDISFDGVSKFNICSNAYGEYTFELAAHYFKNNKDVYEYIKNNSLKNSCHKHTYFLSEKLPELFAITSLCKNYFIGEYYHSYTKCNKDNIIVDLCNNSIIDEKSYNELYEPNEIAVNKNLNIKEKILLVDKNTRQPKSRAEILKIALYDQYTKTIEDEKLSKKGYRKKLKNHFYK